MARHHWKSPELALCDLGLPLFFHGILLDGFELYYMLQDAKKHNSSATASSVAPQWIVSRGRGFSVLMPSTKHSSRAVVKLVVTVVVVVVVVV